MNAVAGSLPFAMLRLAQGDSELWLNPEQGGSIAAFRWRGRDIMRPAVPGAPVLDMASFPLLPFSNRIAEGRFVADGQNVRLSPNFPGIDQQHAIHGFGWQAQWHVAEQSNAHVVLAHHYADGEWPWPYAAAQRFHLTDDGLLLELSIHNQGSSPMPTGLGLHPYFPREGAKLDLPVAGRWDGDGDCLPTRWHALAAQPDWLGGPPIDHVFTGRGGPIRIAWPECRLTILPADDLGFTVVYAPADSDFFCIEPVSHMTDAVNRTESHSVTGLRWLAPDAIWETHVHFAVAAA